MTIWSPVRLSSMHHKHLELGAEIVESDGWQRPARYASVDQELEHIQNAVGICDVSPVGKLNIQGEGLDLFLSAAFPGIELPSIGSVTQYSTESGLAVGEVKLLRLASDELLVLIRPNMVSIVFQSLEENPDQCAHAIDVTSGLAGVRIIGPSSQQLLSSITEIDLSAEAFPDLSCAQIKAAEIHNTLLRSDLKGLPAYDVYFGREFGEYMWDALLETGEEYDVKPIGFEAIGRLEGS